jgi:putative transposase
LDAVKRVESGIGFPDICRELSISTATFHKWWAKYCGMDGSMMSRMKELEEESRRLKKIHLEEKLKAEIVSEALKKSDLHQRILLPLRAKSRC